MMILSNFRYEFVLSNFVIKNSEKKIKMNSEFNMLYLMQVKNR